MADFGRHEMDKETVDTSMKKVMGAVASTDVTTKNQGGGPGAQTLGTYSVKSSPDVAKKLSSANRSGFNGTNSPAPKYQ